MGSDTGIKFEEVFGADGLGELGSGDVLVDSAGGGGVGGGVDFTEAFAEIWLEELRSDIVLVNSGGGDRAGELGAEYAKALEADRPGEFGSGVVFVDGGKGGSIGELADLAEVPGAG